MNTRTLKETHLFEENQKELIEDYLLEWAVYAVKKGSDSYLLVQTILGDDKEIFEKKVKEAMNTESVLDYLQKLQRYGHRGQTGQEITDYFKDKLQPRTVYAQLQKLEKWKDIKKEKLKLNKHEVTFYSAS